MKILYNLAFCYLGVPIIFSRGVINISIMLDLIKSFLLKVILEIRSFLIHVFNIIKYEKNFVLTHVFHGVDLDTTTSNSIEIKKVTIDNLMDASIYEPARKINIFIEFLNSGDLGYYAYYSGQFAHRIWVTFGPNKVARWKRYAVINLNEKECCIHWGETMPRFRNKGILQAVLNKIGNDLIKDGFTVYASTTIDNKSSRQSILKSGYKLVEVVSVKNIFGFRIEKSIPEICWDKYI